MSGRLKSLKQVRDLVGEVYREAWYGPVSLASLVQLKQLTERLQQLQDGPGAADKPRPSREDRERAMGKFRDWFLANGGAMDGVAVAVDLDEGSGLVATADLAREQLAVTVPRPLILSAQRARKEISFLNDEHVKNVPQLVLALFLLRERSQLRSFWHPYINVLPDRFPLLPFQWPMSDLLGLHASPALQELIRVFKTSCWQYAFVYQKFMEMDDPPIPLPVFTFSSFLWAMSVVWSRKNQIPLSAKDPTALTMCLIPGWDFGNHWFGQVQHADTGDSAAHARESELALAKINTFMNFETKSCECHCLVDLKKGDQFFMFYGKRPRSQLFLYMGFLPPLSLSLVRSYDFLAAAFLLVEQVPHYEEKKALLERSDLASRVDENFPLYPSGALAPELLQFLCLLVLDEHEIPASGSQIPQTLKIEQRALGLLCQSCDELLQDYDRPPVVGKDTTLTMKALVEGELARGSSPGDELKRVRAQMVNDLVNGEKDILVATRDTARRREREISKKIKKNEKKKKSKK